ncbi:MAG: VOC family protein [Anaerolineae bacterium]
MEDSIGHVKRYLPGTPSWIDLATTDPDGAKAFYTALFGWEAVDQPAGPDMVYTMLNKGDSAAAALFEMPAEMREGGAPPFWQTYITVADADAATARAADLGATVLGGPYDVMDVGRMSTLQDPTGAAFSLWQPLRHIGCEVVNEHGALTWNELVTRDVAGACSFYEALFGWQGSADEQGYVAYLNEVGGESVYAAGIFPMPDDVPAGVPSHWIPYFWVDGLEAARDKLLALAGSTVTDVMEIGPGKFVVAQDPQGAAFYLFEPASSNTGPSSDKLE